MPDIKKLPVGFEQNDMLGSLDVVSHEESSKSGVLATIGGKFSTSAEPSRNDRTYTPDLWRSVVASDRVKEMLETKTFYGELSHPPRAAEFLSELQMQNVSHNITKLEFDEQSQDLIGTIDILDTPSGKIANTLIKYGSKLGISSRGIVMDDNKYNAKSNEMNPDNYYLVTFDLVALPGIMGARLDTVTESLAPERKAKLILESLNELETTIAAAAEIKDDASVAALEAIATSLKTDSEMKEDPEIQKAVQELTKRDEAPKEEPKEDKPVEKDNDVIDSDKVAGAVLEKELESEGAILDSYQTQKEKFNVDEDGTYDLTTGQPVNFTDGYQVSFERPGDTYTSDQYSDIVKELIARTDSPVYLGSWGGTKELSFHVADYQEAMDIAKQFYQDAIWDWAQGDAIVRKELDTEVKPTEPVEPIAPEEPEAVVKEEAAPKIIKTTSKKKIVVKKNKAKDNKDVKSTLEDAADGVTQSDDIQGGMKSSVNMIGDPMNPDDKKKKSFLESFDNIKTVEDVAKYIESLEGVEKTPNGKVIINKDTVLFNTMLSMINTMRLRSDANPLVKQGTSITNMKELDKELLGEEPGKPEYNQEDKKIEPIKKSIKGTENPHNASLESALKIVKSTTNKVEKLQVALAEAKLEAQAYLHDKEILASRLKSNYESAMETLAKKDALIKELSVKVTESDKSRKRTATEAATQFKSYQALESANQELKTNLYSLDKQNKLLKDTNDKLSGLSAESRKDGRIRKLIEAQSIMGMTLSSDEEAIRAATESAKDYELPALAVSDEQRLAKMMPYKNVSKRK